MAIHWATLMASAADPYMAQVVGEMQRKGVPALPPPSYSLLNAQFQTMAASVRLACKTKAWSTLAKEVQRRLPHLSASEVRAIVREAWSTPIGSCPQQQASRPAAESQYVASLLRLRDSCLDKPPAEIREPLHLGPWLHKVRKSAPVLHSFRPTWWAASTGQLASVFGKAEQTIPELVRFACPFAQRSKT